jgi:gliding motility-associated-like protein
MLNDLPALMMQHMKTDKWHLRAGSRSLLTGYSLVVLSFFAQSQQYIPAVSAGFSLPDTACVNQPVTITNLSTGGTTYDWSFATGTVNRDPEMINFGDLQGLLLDPRYVTLVRDGSQFYSFITDAGNGMVVRNIHAALTSAPLSAVDLVKVDPLNTRIRGIQVKSDNGSWFGFVVRGDVLVRLTFGASLSGTPVVDELGPYPELTRGDGLVIAKQGSDWIGFVTDAAANKVVRFLFGPSLANNAPGVAIVPFVPGVLTNPGQFAMFYQSPNWFAMVCNTDSASISRLEFGNSLLNLPSGTNLGNVGYLRAASGISLTSDCSEVTGYVVNNVFHSNMLVRLLFPGGMAGTVTGIPSGYPGTLINPYKLSEIIRQGDTLYTFVTSSAASSLALMFFPGPGNALPPSSILRDPPPVTYPSAGVYTVMLTVDQGLPTEVSACRDIVIVAPGIISLGNDTTLCNGASLQLDAGAGFASYAWSSGDTTRTMTASRAGVYHVTVTDSRGCTATDSIRLSLLPMPSGTVDTTVCHGSRYFAQHQWQTVSGTYYDTIPAVTGCDSLVITQLTVKLPVVFSLGNDTIICQGSRITLRGLSGATAYTWQDGTHTADFVVTQPGNYWLTVIFQNCDGSDTISIGDCPPQPAKLWVPAAFTPNGDGLNDTFSAVGTGIARFHMLIFNRWGRQIYESNSISDSWNGLNGSDPFPPDVYTYLIEYESGETPGATQKVTGTVTLVR